MKISEGKFPSDLEQTTLPYTGQLWHVGVGRGMWQHWGACYCPSGKTRRQGVDMEKQNAALGRWKVLHEAARVQKGKGWLQWGHLAFDERTSRTTLADHTLLAQQGQEDWPLPWCPSPGAWEWHAVSHQDSQSLLFSESGFFFFLTRCLALSPWLECSGSIMAHCSLGLLNSRDPPISVSWAAEITGMSLRKCYFKMLTSFSVSATCE